MKRILGTIFLLLFMAGALFTGLGCGTTEEGDDAAGSGDTTTSAEEKEEVVDELLEEN